MQIPSNSERNKTRVWKFITGAAVIGLLSFSCSKFRVDDYNPYLFGRVKLGKDLKELQVNIVNRVPTNVPNQLAIVSGLLYVPDFEQSLIKAFNPDGELKFVIGYPKEKQNVDKIKTYNIKLGRIGLVTVSDSEDLFVQSRVSREDVKTDKAPENIFAKKSGEFRTEAEEAIPSVILKINDSGKLVQTIYADGSGGSSPFGYVERMEAANNDQLFVFHRINGEMRLSIFDEAGKLKTRIDSSDFKDAFGTGADITWYTDTILAHTDGDYALGSFSFYDSKSGRFKNRRIFRLDVKDKKVTPIKEIQDPSETLYWVLSNDNFFIWETEVEEGNSIRLQVHDEDGNHVNNIRLNYPPPRGLWRETWMDTNDEIYSMKIRSGYLEIHKWK